MIPEAGFRWKLISAHSGDDKWHILANHGPQLSAQPEQCKIVQQQVEYFLGSGLTGSWEQ